MDSMIVMHVHQTTAGTVRRLRISLPLIPDLVDNQRYWRPDDLPAPAGDELRSWSRPKVHKVLGKPDKPPRRGPR